VKAEELILIGNAHGVDLVAAAQVAAKRPQRDIKFIVRNGRRIPVLLPAAMNGARGKQSPSFARPQWSMQELGVAAAGVSDLLFMAACYAFAGSQNNFWRLHAALTDEAEKMGARYQWPDTVKDIHGIAIQYREHLAKLVLDEDTHQAYFVAAPVMYSVYMNVHEVTWDRQLAERFSSLKFVWLRWLGTAASTIQSRLSEHS